MNRMQFMNTAIDNITFVEAVDRCIAMAKGDTTGHYVVTPNVDIIVKMERDEELGRICSDADLSLADGQPLIWLSKLYGSPINEKISGSDLFPAICKRCAKEELSLFFFGAATGVAAMAAQNLAKRFPDLNVVETFSPDYGFEKDPVKVAGAIDIINAAAPDILVVGLGCPKQERFVYRNRDRLNAKLSLNLGASLDFEAGNVKRAPQWMRNHGLEWLFRITQDPGRLAKRYLVDDMRIVPLAFKYWKAARFNA